MATNLGNQFQKPDFCSISLRKEVENFSIICANRRNFLLTGHGWPSRLFPTLLLPFTGRDSAFIPTQGTGRSGSLCRPSPVNVRRDWSHAIICRFPIEPAQIDGTVRAPDLNS